VGELQQVVDEKDVRFDGCIRSVAQALARAYHHRGKRAEHQGGDYSEVIADYESAMRICPGYAPVFNDLGNLLASCPVAELRDGVKAAQNATKACELTNWKDYRYISTLAAACAEAGDFDSALKWQKEAIGLLPGDKGSLLHASYESRLQLYQSDKPYHESQHKGLVAWWKFDGDATDSSGHGHHGKLLGDARIISETQRGQVLRLDGEGDYVRIASGTDFDLTGEITVAAWIKVNKFDKNWQSIITKGDSAWRLARERDQDSLQFCCGPGGIRRLARGSREVDDDQWYHVAGVYDGTRICLYVDGKLDVSVSSTGRIDTNREPVYIGENSERRGRFWDGLIDDVRVYSYALSEAQIEALYGGHGRDPTQN
jgi:tetratricopeptide (TPR) repeat protein